MKQAIAKRLELCSSLPSMPAAAARIVELARDPSASMRHVAEVVRTDPALAAKILKMANSPLYARRCPCESFQQALVRLGLNSTLSLALTFSIANGLREQEGIGLDYTRTWKRSLIAATAARVLGFHFGIGEVEDLFLAGLLQDIGMLALDRAYPELYSALNHGEQEHDRVRTLETSQLGTDHAEVGAWLLERWNLPARLCKLVGASHDLLPDDHPDEETRVRQVIALSGPIADVWMSATPEASLNTIQLDTLQVQGLAGPGLATVLESMAHEALEIESLFEIGFLDRQRTDWILQEARETLVLRNLQTMQESTRLREVAASLREQARVIEEKSKLDNLTGTFNRGHLDSTLAEWFAESNRSSMPLSLVFMDLDNFKQVNDVHGHHVGDKVLSRFAEMVHQVSRSTDMVARYGGEEFVLLLRECGAEGARRLCDRILNKCRSLEHALESGELLKVTVSLGLVTHGEKLFFENGPEMIRAADGALYKAKQSGKNRCVEHDPQANAA